MTTPPPGSPPGRLPGPPPGSQPGPPRAATHLGASLNDSSALQRWSVFGMMLAPGALLGGLLLQLLGSEDYSMLWSLTFTLANPFGVFIALHFIYQTDTRIRRTMRSSVIEIHQRRAPVVPALGRVVRSQATGRVPAPLPPGGPPLGFFTVVEAALPEGPRRVAVFTPPVQKNTVLPLLVHAGARDSAILHPGPVPPGLPAPGAARSELTISGGLPLLLVFGVAGLLTGAGAGIALILTF